MSTFLRRCRHGLWRLYRRPLLFSVAAIAVGATTFATAGGVGGAGPTTSVLVLTRDVSAGTPLVADDVRLVDRTISDVPPDALTEMAPGRVALVDLAEGEAVLDRRLAPGGIGPVAALLPPGASGVTLPTGGLPVGLVVGDRLDLFAVVPGSTTTLATAVPVIGIDERSVTVAVPSEAAGRVVEATTLGQLVAVLAPSW